MPLSARSPAIAPTLREPDGDEEVARTIRSILKGLAGLRPEEVVPGVNWFALGLDSLLIVQLQQALGRHYAIDLPLAAVMEHGDTLERLVALVVPRLPRTSPAPVASGAPVVPAESAPAAPRSAMPPQAGLEGLLGRQIDAMSALFQRQIQLIQGSAPAQAAPASAAPVQAPPAAPVREIPSHETPPRGTQPHETPAREIKGLFKALPGRRQDVDPAQGAHVARLAAAYNARTRASKEHTARHRGVYANPRAVIGFRPEWKELTYPLHVERAAGAHVWDLDGHRYVDITMGFGVTLFGHNPDFIRAALEAEIGAGYPVGPQTARAGRVAALIRRMTGVERVAFFTTGSEAVMVALRLARARTGRRRIAMFTNSYHGTFDGVLASGWSDGARATTMPVSDGTPQGMVEDVIVLRYGDPEALDTLRLHAADLAAVVVEPVQSRDPSVQPRDFLHALRALTEESGVALIFDETITGFRIHPGGAQAHFGVRADIVTYGKVVGGGLPIGVVSGRAHYLDAVDGGDWQYGDDSGPAARTAFVAGTFNNHPLTMAAAEAVLIRLEAEGPALQDRLNARTAALCAELNALFAEEEVPIRMVHFSSLFRFEFSGDTEILNYHLLNEGVFVWEGRNCFLSAAHDEADLRHLVEAVRRGLAAMRQDGWLPPRGPGRPRQVETFAESLPAAPADDLSLSRGQGEMRALIEARPEASLAYNEMIALALDGPLDTAALGAALRMLAERHEALRCIGLDDHAWYSAASLGPVPAIESVADEDAAVTARHARDLGTPFDLDRGPLLRALLLRRGPERHVLALTVHHIVADGWSLGLMATELAELYAAARAGRTAALPPATSFRDFVAWSRRQAAEEDALERDPERQPGRPASETEVRDRLIEMTDVLVRDIILPPRIVAAIQSKIEQEQLVKEMRFRVEREQFESERKVVEAKGIKEFQEIVQAGISDAYLKWRGIEATVMLATSPNAKTVVIGGNGGLPLILNTGDAATPHSPAALGTAPGPQARLPQGAPQGPVAATRDAPPLEGANAYEGSVDVSRPELKSQQSSPHSLGAPLPAPTGAWSRDLSLGLRAIPSTDPDAPRQSALQAVPAPVPTGAIPLLSSPAGVGGGGTFWTRMGDLLSYTGWFGGPGNGDVKSEAKGDAPNR